MSNMADVIAYQVAKTSEPDAKISDEDEQHSQELAPHIIIRTSIQVSSVPEELQPKPDTPRRSRVDRLMGKWIRMTIREKRAVRTSTPNVFHIEKLRGGGFNRIIGITINPSSDHGEELVLRMP